MNYQEHRSKVIQKQKFNFVCRIELKLNLDGSILTEKPCGGNKEVLHRYGEGPFSKFRIPTDIRDEGVHVLISDDDDIKYIGGSANLAQGYNSGFGRISIRSAPFIGGNETYCRINTLILKQIKSGSTIELWFKKTAEYHTIKSRLVHKINPEWNR